MPVPDLISIGPVELGAVASLGIFLFGFIGKGQETGNRPGT